MTLWRFKPIFSAGLRVYSHLFGDIQLRSNPTVAGNRTFGSWFLLFVAVIQTVQLRGLED